MEDKPTYHTRPHFVHTQKEEPPFRLSKWVAIIAWLNVLLLAWLMIGRVVSSEGMNRTIFWVFLGVALVASLVQAMPAAKVGGSSGGQAAMVQHTPPVVHDPEGLMRDLEMLATIERIPPNAKTKAEG